MSKTNIELSRVEAKSLDRFVKKIVECTMIQCHKHFSNENETNTKEYLNNNFSDTWSSVKEEVFGDVIELAKFRRIIATKIIAAEKVDIEHDIASVSEKPCLPTPLDLNFLDKVVFDLSIFVSDKNIKESLINQPTMDQYQNLLSVISCDILQIIDDAYCATHGQNLPFTDIGKYGFIQNVSDKVFNEIRTNSLRHIGEGIGNLYVNRNKAGIHNNGQHLEPHNQPANQVSTDNQSKFINNSYSGRMDIAGSCMYGNMGNMDNGMISIPISAGSLVSLEVRSPVGFDYVITIPKDTEHNISIRKPSVNRY